MVVLLDCKRNLGGEINIAWAGAGQCMGWVGVHVVISTKNIRHAYTVIIRFWFTRSSKQTLESTAGADASVDSKLHNIKLLAISNSFIMMNIFALFSIQAESKITKSR